MTVLEENAVFYVGWPLVVFGMAYLVPSYREGAKEFSKHLKKPIFYPPDFVFGVVWFLLYILLGITAAIVHTQGNFTTYALELGIFLLHILINVTWSFVFWGRQWFGLAVIHSIILLLIAIANGILFGMVDLTAGLLFIPYVLWLIFATILSISIWCCNKCWKRRIMVCKWVRCEDYANANRIGAKLDTHSSHQEVASKNNTFNLILDDQMYPQ